MFSAHDDNLGNIKIYYIILFTYLYIKFIKAMILPFLGLTSMDCLNQLYYDGTTTALEC